MDNFESLFRNNDGRGSLREDILGLLVGEIISCSYYLEAEL